MNTDQLWDTGHTEAEGIAAVESGLPWADVVNVVDVADIETDLGYARRQLRDALKCGGPFSMTDRIERALDALERIINTCEAAVA